MYTEFDGLSSVERACYQKILQCLENFQTEFKIFDTHPDAIVKAYRAVLGDHPEFFWLTGAGKYTTSSLGGVIQDVVFRAEIRSGLSMRTIPSMASALDRAVSEIVERARRCRSTFDQVLFVHDTIIDTTRYDLTNPACYDAYGCLVQNRAVCAGYAKAFMLIMKKLGYVCGYATGWGVRTGETHAWNFIQLDGNFYFIDVTWDDPTVTGQGAGYDNKTRHYFCITSSELQKTHRLSNEFRVPCCEGTRYNYYNYNGFTLGRYSFQQVAEIASMQLKRDKKFTIKFSTPSETGRAFADLIENRNVYNIPGMGRSILYSRSENGLILTVENK